MTRPPAASDPVSALGLALASDGRMPDFVERSSRVRDTIESLRSTHYFDRNRSRIAFEAFVDAAARCGFAVPAGLERWLDEYGSRAQSQGVVGVDGNGPVPRLKYYAVLEPGHAEAAKALLERLGVSGPDRQDWGACHIVGLDVTAEGVHDVKLYWLLDPERASNILRRPRRWATLIANLRQLVLQESLLQPRARRLHFAVSDDVRFAPYIRARMAAVPGTRLLNDHVESLSTAGVAHSAQIVAMEYVDGELDESNYTVYLHPIDPGSRR